MQYDREFATAAGPILAMAAAAPKPAVHDVEGRRAGMQALMALINMIPPTPDVKTTEYKIKSYDGVEIIVYHYGLTTAEQGTKPGPALIHVHGGGMIAGSASEMSPGCRALVSASGVQAFDIEYRLAPENRHPTLVEDSYAALLWLHQNAEKFNVDKARIGIMGESAGGGISAGVALMARDRKLSPPLAKQILVYPMLDSRTQKIDESIDKFLVWTVDSNITGWTALLGDDVKGQVSEYASPAHAKDLAGLPSTFIDVGSLDLFRDEDMEYAARLAKADVDVEFHLYPGVPHAFEIFGGQITITQQAMANRVRALKSF